MKLFKLDSSPKTNLTAPILQTKFSQGIHHLQPVEDMCLAADHCFGKVSTAGDLDSLVLLGYANNGAVGDYTGSQFVEKFDEQYTKQFTNPNDKLKLKHIYLIGYADPSESTNENSLLKTMANELYKKGFYNVVVHGIAPPQDLSAKYTGMRVVIAANDDRRMVGEGAGHVKALLFTKESEKALTKLDDEIDNLKKQIKTQSKSSEERTRLKYKLEYKLEERKHFMEEALKSKDIYELLSTNDIKRKLDKKAYTVIPDESDIDYVPYATKLTIKELEARLQELIVKDLAEKNKSKDPEKHYPDYKIELLRKLISDIKKSDDVLGEIIKAKQLLEKKERFPNSSATYILFQKIIKKEEAAAVCDELINTIQAGRTKQAERASSVGSKMEEDAPQQSERKPKKAKKKPAEKNQSQPRKTIEIPHPIALSISNMRKYAAELHSDFEAKSWLARHTWDKIKLYKSDKLIAAANEIEKTYRENPAVFNLNAQMDDLLKDGKLIQGTFSHKTKYLLINIKQGQPEHYTNDPRKYSAEKSRVIVPRNM